MTSVTFCHVVDPSHIPNDYLTKKYEADGWNAHVMRGKGAPYWTFGLVLGPTMWVATGKVLYLIKRSGLEFGMNHIHWQDMGEMLPALLLPVSDRDGKKIHSLAAEVCQMLTALYGDR